METVGRFVVCACRVESAEQGGIDPSELTCSNEEARARDSTQFRVEQPQLARGTILEVCITQVARGWSLGHYFY
jgi:hypothetical protein